MQTLHASLAPAPAPGSLPNPNLDPAAVGAPVRRHIKSVVASEQLARSTAGRGAALHVVTPLVYSETLSRSHDVYLKMDCLQPSGSFKIRGIGAVCQQAYKVHGPDTHIVTSSGGNAGLAAATAAKTLGVRCTVIVPRRTEPSVVQLLRDLGAAVDNSTAEVWDDADALARAVVHSEGGTYVHPFEGDMLTRGHASLVPEIQAQLAQAGVEQPDMLVCSVGGGGLIRGIIHGYDALNTQNPESGTRKPRIVAVQDFGADSFSRSFNKWLVSGGIPEVVSIPAITSKATSMGAKTCSGETLRLACRYSGIEQGSQDPSRLSAVVVDDAVSGSACWQFYRDHQIMVEMACGAALAPVYQPRIMDALLAGDETEGRKTIVIIVCGGSKIDLETLDAYEREYGMAQDRSLRVMIDGKEI